MSVLSQKHAHRYVSDSAETPDLDVTPIMNMFIILIPFLVSMAVFTQVSILNFSLPPNVGVNLDQSQGKPEIKLTVVITPEYLAITEGDIMLDSIPVSMGEFDIDRFSGNLKENRERSNVQDEVIVAVRDAVRFKHVVKVMDLCRDAGFKKMGLSNATENEDEEYRI